MQMKEIKIIIDKKEIIIKVEKKDIETLLKIIEVFNKGTNLI